jgi:hypothetical protein
MTIYEQTAGSLIPQPDRTVATFDSGLIRVDQGFVGTTANAETHRATLAVGNDFPGDTSPAYDGLFIFPAAQESRTGDGLTTFKVSGYGRSTDQLRSQRRGTTATTIRSSYTESSLGIPGSPNTSDFAIIIASSLVGKIAIIDEDGLTYEQLNFQPSFGEPLAVIPLDPADVIEEMSRSSITRSAVNWDGQIYQETITTVKIGRPFVSGGLTTYRVAFYKYSTPVIKIDFSSSFGVFTELGINVSVPIEEIIVPSGVA